MYILRVCCVNALCLHSKLWESEVPHGSRDQSQAVRLGHKHLSPPYPICTSILFVCLLCCFVFVETVSACIQGWLQTCDPPALASQGLELQAWATVPASASSSLTASF